MIIRTVMIAITITVTTVGTFGSIQNHGKILETLFAINIFQFGKHGPVQQAGADYVRSCASSPANFPFSNNSVGLGGTVPTGIIFRLAYLSCDTKVSSQLPTRPLR